MSRITRDANFLGARDGSFSHDIFRHRFQVHVAGPRIAVVEHDGVATTKGHFAWYSFGVDTVEQPRIARAENLEAFTGQVDAVVKVVEARFAEGGANLVFLIFFDRPFERRVLRVDERTEQDQVQ